MNFYQTKNKKKLFQGINIGLIIILLLQSVLISFLPVGVEDAHAVGWLDAAWNKRTKITIDQVGEDLSNFPVLISVTSTDFSAALANGYDLAFTSSDGTTQLDHEIESWDDSTGALVAWVKVSLSGSATTDIYLYYANINASNQQDPTNVWSSNYSAVWHMSQSPVGSVLDSTSYDNDLTATNMDGTNLLSGVIGNAIQVNLDEVLTASPSTSFSMAGDFTISGWIRKSTMNTFGAILTKYNGTDQGNYNYLFAVGDNNKLAFIDTDTQWQYGNSAISANTFYYATLVKSGANGIVYLNGSNNGGGVMGTMSTTGSIVEVGRWYYPTNFEFRGKIDELRLASTARSAGWVLAEYQNQNSPSTFLVLASEESYTPAVSEFSNIIFMSTLLFCFWYTLRHIRQRQVEIN